MKVIKNRTIVLITIVAFLSFICMLVLSVIAFFLVCLYGRVVTADAQEKIPLMIEADPSVSKAVILFDDGIVTPEFCIEIFFKEGGRLKVFGVNEKGKGEIEIDEVGGYRVGVIDKRGVSLLSATDMHNPAMKFWSAITGLQLKSVMDLVRNYQIIYSCVESSPNDYRSANFQEKSREDKEKEMDAAHEIMVKTHPASSRATLDGEEYFLLKWEKATDD